MNEDSLRHELKVYKASLEQQVAPPGMVRTALPPRAPACMYRRVVTAAGPDVRRTQLLPLR